MRYPLTVVFFGLLLSATAQVNLVPNPSFEDTTHCPGTGGLDGLSNWFYCGGSPDYYNVCSNPSYSSVPNNWLGFQYPRTGNAYVGLATWAVMASPNREYIGVQLSQALSVGSKYFVTAYIVRSDSGESPPSTCATNNFGFLFSTVAYDYINSAPTNNSPHVFSDSIINDSQSWSKVTGTFIADSSYQYLVLGNFFTNLNTDTMSCNYTFAFAYYFIDDVCVSTDSLTCEIGIGIEEDDFSNSHLGLYPNPATDVLAISNLTSHSDYYCSIYNALGDWIFSTSVNYSHNQIMLPALAPGLYFIEINNQRLKFIVTHK